LGFAPDYPKPVAFGSHEIFSQYCVQAVIDNNFVVEAKFPRISTGKHVIRVWRLDDNALLTRLVVSSK
jgi:hypothetical protein